MMPKKAIIHAAAVTLALSAGFADAAPFSWTGASAAPKAFNNPANWTPAGVPGVGDRALFVPTTASPLSDTVLFTNSPSNENAFVGNSASIVMNQSGDQTWNLNLELRVENLGTLTLNGVDLNCNALLPDFNGAVFVNSGSRVTANAVSLGTVGVPGNYGRIDVNPGGTLVSNTQTNIGRRSNQTATINFSGGAGTLTQVWIAESSANTNAVGGMAISNGGVVHHPSSTLRIATQGLAGQAGTLSVSGPGSAFNYGSSGSITIGGTVNSAGTVAVSNSGVFNITSPAAMTINSLGTVTINNATFTSAGAVTVNGRLLNTNGTLRASTMTVGGAGVLTSSGVGSITSNLTNSGTINLGSGSFAVGGSTNNNGTIIFNGAGLTASFGNVSGIVSTFASLASGSVTFNHLRQTRAQIQGTSRFITRSNGTAAGTSRVNELIFGNLAGGEQSRWDLNDNDLVVDYPAAGPSPLPSVRQALAFGYNGGNWNGVGLLSSAAATQPGFALGYGESSAIFSSFPAGFSGQSVDSTAVLVGYTRYGDANLDGLINLADFNRLAANFGAAAGATWTDGDFNYDGVVNLSDFNHLAANFGLSAGPGGPMPQDWAALAAAVPEPAAAVLLAPLLVLVRRRSVPHMPTCGH